MGVAHASGPPGTDEEVAPGAKLTYPEAKSFVEQLNRGRGIEGALPGGYTSGRFALPTTNQWAAAVEASKAPECGLQSLASYPEWCGDDGDDQGTTAAFFPELNESKFVKSLESQTNKVALRLVLIP
jgi:hypothetical protein